MTDELIDKIKLFREDLKKLHDKHLKVIPGSLPLLTRKYGDAGDELIEKQIHDDLEYQITTLRGWEETIKENHTNTEEAKTLVKEPPRCKTCGDE